jgi:hypothetical protein
VDGVNERECRSEVEWLQIGHVCAGAATRQFGKEHSTTIVYSYVNSRIPTTTLVIIVVRDLTLVLYFSRL